LERHFETPWFTCDSLLGSLISTAHQVGSRKGILETDFTHLKFTSTAGSFSHKTSISNELFFFKCKKWITNLE